MKLYRPVGLTELALIFDAGMNTFPPRLSEQPIFYPVLNEKYAEQIAREWNAPDAGSQFAGYVTEFEVESDYAARFPRKVVGSYVHEELWVPAEELPEFNLRIIGYIRVIRAFFGPAFTGFVPPQFGLEGKSARDQFICLAGTFGYSGMDFICELAANRKAVFLNFPYWFLTDFSTCGISPELKSKVLSAVQKMWVERSPQTSLCGP